MSILASQNAQQQHQEPYTIATGRLTKPIEIVSPPSHQHFGMPMLSSYF
jgi:hypothetical protein